METRVEELESDLGVATQNQAAAEQQLVHAELELGKLQTKSRELESSSAASAAAHEETLALVQHLEAAQRSQQHVRVQLEESVRRLEADLLEANNKINAAPHLTPSGVGPLEQVDAELAKLKEANAVLTSRLKLADTALDEHRSESTKLKRMLADVDAERARALGDLEDRQEMLARLTGELETQRNANLLDKDKIKWLEKSSNELDEKVRKSERQIDGLYADVAQSKRVYSELEEKYEQECEANRLLEEQIEEQMAAVVSMPM